MNRSQRGAQAREHRPDEGAVAAADLQAVLGGLLRASAATPQEQVLALRRLRSGTKTLDLAQAIAASASAPEPPHADALLASSAGLIVQAEALWGGVPRILARLPLSNRPSPNPRRRLGPGTVWIAAGVLVPGRPADEFVGLHISGGTAQFAGLQGASGDTLTLSGAWKIALHLRPRGPANPPPGASPGADASDAAVTLPPSFDLTLDSQGNLALGAGDARASAYGRDLQFSMLQGPAFLDELTASVVLPGRLDAAAFSMELAQSQLFRAAGSAPVTRSGWALKTTRGNAASLGELSSAGALWIEWGPLRGLAWPTLAQGTALPRAVLQLAPGAIEFAARAPTGLLRQSALLWEETAAPTPRASSVDLTSDSASVLAYGAVPGSELVTLSGTAHGHLDRPLQSDGGRLRLDLPQSTAFVFQDTAGIDFLLLASDPDAASAPHLSLVLHNALLKVRPARFMVALGPLVDGRIEAGALALAFANRAILPTLPDPYAASFDFDRTQDRDQGLVLALVQWTAPAAATLGFSSFGVPGAGAAVPGTISEQSAASFQPPRVLLDVSSAVDQFGVALPFNGGNADLKGLNLVAPADQVAVVTLPPISWEPMLTKTPTPGGGDVVLPPPPNDGGIAGLQAEDPSLSSIEPVALLALYNDAIDARRHFLATLPLPFGLVAQLNSRLYREGDRSDFIDLGGSVYLHQPQFAPDYSGGLQWGIAGPPSSDVPVVTDPTLPGYLEFSSKDQYAQAVLSTNVYTRLSGDFGRRSTRGIPLRRYELSGYGASLFSDWRDTASVGPAIIEARFDVLVGRTAHEVVQMQSVLYPWFVRVVRTITMDRRTGGWVLREDSGWVAATPGFFDYPPGVAEAFPPERRHPGAVQGVEAVRNISLAGAQFPEPASASQLIWQPVRFDADVVFADWPAPRLGVAGGSMQRRVASGGITGWIQIGGPTYTDTLPDGTPIERVRPASAQDLRDLHYLVGAASAPLDCVLEFGGTPAQPGLVLRASRADVDVAGEAGSLQLVGAVRGSPRLPRDGTWTLARLGGGDAAPKALDAGFPVPVLRPNPGSALAGSDRWHLAEPSDIAQLADNALPSMRYSFVQALGAQKVNFDRPRVSQDVAPISLPQPPKLADMGAILHAVGVFPGLADAFDFQSLKALHVDGDALKFQESFAIGDGSKTAVLLDLGGSDALQLRIEYHDEGVGGDSPSAPKATVATVTVDPAASPRWAITLQRVCFAVQFRGQALISIFATLTADELHAPTVRDLRVRYEGLLNSLQAIFSNIEQVARFLPGGSAAGLKVGFSQGHLTVRNQFALPSLPLGAGQITDIACDMGFDVSVTPLGLSFSAGLGSEQNPFHWIVSPLSGTGVVRVGVGSGGLDVLVQAGLGVGLAIDLGIASGSASVALAIELVTAPTPFEIKIILSGRASVDVLQGLASATITLAAGVGVIPPDELLHPPFLPPQLLPPPNPVPPITVGLVASVSAGIHLSVCWVVDVDWDGYWQFRQDIKTPAIPLPI
ncbi:hypothetical protein [Roseateles saccharophilus]|uniref:Uncharacterized protein n=1 Tax=Roseateles saccharophilus TaxID=304 RepID=A0A4R3UMP3_ROSSA|nr:hypothetical protein [Roseateles saccharophilus]MDG0833609.1 hypothetical protein [Roseateles saccharophilus]TCU92142.1 hypothetical protein EV671_10237 [Roseateles saccharophilus]